MNPSAPEKFRAWFPAVVFERGRFRVVACCDQNKTVRDSIRFRVEGSVPDALGSLSWSEREVSERTRVQMLEEALEAFVAAKAEDSAARSLALVPVGGIEHFQAPGVGDLPTQNASAEQLEQVVR